MFDRILSLRVSDVMTKDPVTVRASESMADVARLFATERMHAAPVVDDAGVCVGIVTASDFVKRTEAYTASDGMPNDLVRHEEGICIEPQSYEYVSQCMTDGIQSIAPSTPLIKAARIMTDAHLHMLPVIENDRPVGILSNLDVVAALVNAFDESRNTF